MIKIPQLISGMTTDRVDENKICNILGFLSLKIKKFRDFFFSGSEK